MMHFMLDLETLSTETNAVVTQIGLVPFNRDGIVDEGLRINVDPEEQIRHGRHASWSTIEWWLRQSDGARASITAVQDRAAVGEALMLVNRYFAEHAGSDPWAPRVWSNGAGFDVPIMESLYKRSRSKCPWNFSRVRDVRTLAALCPDVRRVDPEIAHDALSDAIAQAKWMVACAEDLNVLLT